MMTTAVILETRWAAVVTIVSRILVDAGAIVVECRFVPSLSGLGSVGRMVQMIWESPWALGTIVWPILVDVGAIVVEFRCVLSLSGLG